MTIEEINDSAGKILREKIKIFKCPMCQKGPFMILPGVLNISVISQLSELQLGDKNAPCIGLVCGNCGFTSFHNLLALGIQDLSTNILNYNETSTHN